MGSHPVWPHRAHELLEEADDAIGQIIDHEEDHQAEDGQFEVGDALEHQGEGVEGEAQDHGNERLPALLGPAPESPGARCHRHQCDQQGDAAEQFDVRQEVGQIDHDGRADDRPQPRLAPAHGHRQQEGDGEFEAEIVRRDILLRIGEEHPRQPRESRAGDEGDDLVAIDADAHAVRSDGAVAQGLEGAAQMRGQHPVDHDHRQQQQEGADVEILHLAHALQVHLEDGQRIAPLAPVEEDGRVERDPQGAVGQVQIAEPGSKVRHLVDEDLHDGAEGERHHGQIGAGYA